MPKDIKGLPRTPRGKVASFTPTDIVYMDCLECGQHYTRRVGLPINGKESMRLNELVVKPCIGIPSGNMLQGIKDEEDLTDAQMEAIDRRVNAKEKCGSMNYRIGRKMEPVAMPIGRHFTDLSRKNN